MSKQVGRVLLASLLLAGCTSEVERFCESNADCEGTDYPFCDLEGEFPASEGHGKTCIPVPFDAAVDSPDAGGRDASPVADASPAACEPDQTSCSGDVLTECSSEGTVVRSEECALGCAASADRCHKLVPSNGLALYLELARDSGPLDLPAGAVIDTTAGTIQTAAGDDIEAPSALVGAPADGVDVRVFWGSSITLRDATVRGVPALAFVSPGGVDVVGTIDVRTAGVLQSCGASPIFMQAATDQCPGNAGGSFGDRGGHGGSAGGVGGRTAAPAQGTEEIVPLRGGCSGGDVRRGTNFNWTGSAGGAAGGALQISSETGIWIATANEGAEIEANGRAGFVRPFTPTPDRCGGGGGGSGGAILLEAPKVVVGSLASILANGGGGSCYANDGGESAGASSPGAGAVCGGTVAGEGGDGGTRSTAARNGTAGVPDPPDFPVAHGGGGGGSVGRIRINTASGSFTSPAAISPVPSVGTVVTE